MICQQGLGKIWCRKPIGMCFVFLAIPVINCISLHFIREKVRYQKDKKLLSGAQATILPNPYSMHEEQVMYLLPRARVAWGEIRFTSPDDDLTSCSFSNTHRTLFKHIDVIFATYHDESINMYEQRLLIQLWCVIEGRDVQGASRLCTKW